MRCFIGIDFNCEALKKVNNISFSLAKSGVKGNFTSKNNIHLTLLFLGELDTSDIEKVKKIIDSISFDSFFIKVNKLTKLKDIIVLEVEKSSELLKLQKEIALKIKNNCPNLKKANVDGEYYPHITLVRENKDNIFKEVNIISEVRNIYLFSSNVIDKKLTYLKEYEGVCKNGKD